MNYWRTNISAGGEGDKSLRKNPRKINPPKLETRNPRTFFFYRLIYLFTLGWKHQVTVLIGIQIQKMYCRTDKRWYTTRKNFDKSDDNKILGGKNNY